MMIYDYKTDMGKERAGSILALVQIRLLTQNSSPSIVAVALKHTDNDDDDDEGE